MLKHIVWFALPAGLAACANGPYFNTAPEPTDARTAMPADAGTTPVPVPDLSRGSAATDLNPAGLRPPRGDSGANHPDASTTPTDDAPDAAAAAAPIEPPADDASADEVTANDVTAGDASADDVGMNDADDAATSDAADPMVRALRARARPLTGAAEDYEPLLDLVGDAHYVLLGEESHGSHEFYAAREAITQRLITERGFTAVAVEGNWPDLARADRFVRGESDDATAENALGDVQNFPVWMWRNRDVAHFLTWLRAYNAAVPAGATKVGFYGLDLQALPAAVDKVLAYLDAVDPEAATRARARYGCLGDLSAGAWTYYNAVQSGAARSCAPDVADEYADLLAHRGAYEGDAADARERYFLALGSARVAVDGEAYYRAGGSWNLRDEHMDRALGELAAHQAETVSTPRVALWVHNTHAGDERGTDGADYAVENLGMLLAQRAGRDAVHVGLTTYTGTVTSAPYWGGNFGFVTVATPDPDSVERVLHDVGMSAFVVALRDDETLMALDGHHLERGIGVVYNTTYDAYHYFGVHLAQQFDAVVHIDATTAVVPLDPTPEWSAGVPGGTALP